MRTLRICIGSNDGENIATTHMGDTEHFYIYDLVEDSGGTFIEQRKNIAKEMEHAQADKMKAIISIVDDAEIFVAQQKSPNFIKIAKQTKYQPVVVNVENIEAILILLESEFDNIYSHVERRRNGEVFDLIPALSAS